MSKQPDKHTLPGMKNPETYLRAILSRGVWSKALAVRKLLNRGVPEEAAETLVAMYEEAGFFDDAAYALLFVETHPEWGVIRLRDELRRRGLADKDIRSALDGVEEEERAATLAAEWLRGGMERRKVEERLVRRGFSRQACRNALERACEGEL